MNSNRRSSAVLCAMALVLTACAAGPAASAGPTTAGRSASGSDARSATYSSTTFVVPFEVEVPGWLPAQPSVEESNFVTWESTSEDRKVRMLVPVTVYLPGETTPSPPPADYLPYLLGQAQSGGEFTDQETVQVDGREATLLTATTGSGGLDGSLGCQSEGMAAEDCWGLQPDLTLRIAVIPLDGTTLLAWSRTVRDDPGSDDQIADFDQMISTLQLG
jgi:hypothetical protein